jgi:hypothetical protein
MSDIGYSQHGPGTAGPFRTESVRIRHTPPDVYHAWYEGRWRVVHVQLRRLFIVYRGGKIKIQIEGV